MNLLKLAWKNIIHNPLSLVLNLILLILGIGLINFIVLLNTQLKGKFEKNLAGIDMVIGAKGSPLQLILCGMYHIDSPTGNISVADAKPFLRDGHPLIKRSVPLSLGDSYKGYRIVGTDHTMLDLYEAEIGTGKIWEHTFEVTAGANVAKDLNLSIGSTFKSSHGLEDAEDLEHDHGTFEIVGILKPTGSVVDQLLLTSTGSVWEVHDHEEVEDEVEGEGHDHDHAHDHSHHVHDNSRAHLLEHGEKDITSVLIQFKNRTNFQALNLPRNINENTNLQAASPAIEINRLYDMMGVGTRALQLIALLIAIVSAISIFVSLLNSLRQRKYELSLLRVLGGSPGQLLLLIILEGVITAFLGFVLGFLASHISMAAMADNLTEKYNYAFQSWTSHGSELTIFIGTLLLGAVASLLPAYMAYRTNIHKNLME